MKRFIILAVLLSSLCSCEKIYDEDEVGRELGVEIDWAFFGWEEIHNDSSTDITLTFPSDIYDPRFVTLDYDIKSKEYITFEVGASAPSLECPKVTITLKDGKSLELKRGGNDEISKAFFDNYVRSTVEKIIDFDGKKIRRHLTLDKYYITDEMIEIIRN